jgi:hypothetical protein
VNGQNSGDAARRYGLTETGGQLPISDMRAVVYAPSADDNRTAQAYARCLHWSIVAQVPDACIVAAKMTASGARAVMTTMEALAALGREDAHRLCQQVEAAGGELHAGVARERSS